MMAQGDKTKTRMDRIHDAMGALFPGYQFVATEREIDMGNSLRFFDEGTLVSFANAIGAHSVQCVEDTWATCPTCGEELTYIRTLVIRWDP